MVRTRGGISSSPKAIKMSSGSDSESDSGSDSGSDSDSGSTASHTVTTMQDLRDISIKELPKFSGKQQDYAAWSLKARAMMRLKGLNPWRADADDAYDDDVKQLIADLLLLCMDEKNTQMLAEHADDGIALVRALERKYVRKDMARRQELKGKLQKAKLRSHDMDGYITHVSGLIAELRQAGATVGEEDEFMYYAMPLPDTYTEVISRAMNDGCDISTLRGRLISHARVMNMRSAKGSASTSVSHQSVDNMGVRGGRPGKKGSITCDNCGIRGHTKQECRKVGGGAFKPFEGDCRRCGRNGHRANQCKEEKRPKESKGAARAASGVVVIEGSAEVTTGGRSFTAQFGRDEWLLDSAASHFITPHRELLDDYSAAKGAIRVGDDRALPVEGVGSFVTKVHTREGRDLQIRWPAVHCPRMKHNLMSERLWKESGGGLHCPPKGQDYVVLPGGHGTVNIERRDGQLFMVTGRAEPTAAHVSPLQLWHRRLAHAGKGLLKTAQKHVEGIEGTDTGDIPTCEPCLAGKMKQDPFPRSTTVATVPGEIIEADLQGPLPRVQHDGSLHRFTLIDHATDYRWTYPLKRKSDAPEKYEEFTSDLAHPVKTLRIDGAGELGKGRMSQLTRGKGTKLQTTNPYTPEQIGKIGKAQDTATNDALAMLYDAKLPQEFLTYAYEYAVWIRNRLPTRGGCTPYERLFGSKPDVSTARVFGAVAYRHVRKAERKDKFAHKMQKCIFLGFKPGVKGYLLMDCATGRTLTSRSVRFDENNPGGTHLQETEQEDLDEDYTPEDTRGATAEHHSRRDEERNAHTEGGTPESVPSGGTRTTRETSEEPTSRPSRRRAKPTEWWKGNGSANLSYAAAMKSPQQAQWSEAMASELASLEAMGAWRVVDMSEAEDKRIIRPLWRLSEKLDENGNVYRLKARLVARGDMLPRSECPDVHAPVVSSNVLNIFCALAVHYEWTLNHVDFTTAFLNSDLDEVVYMHPPRGMDVSGGKVLRLLKSLYGLPQSGKNWYNCLSAYLVDIGFVQLECDRCVFVRQRGSQFIAIGAHVDDLLTLTDCQRSYDILHKELEKKFKLGKCTPLRHYCGIVVRRTEDTIALSQPYYTENILTAFDMSKCNPRATPADPAPLRAAAEGEEPMDKQLYASAVGSLLWLSTNTRPDIAHAVQRAATYMAQPTAKHWSAVKQIFRYLRGSNRGLLYKKSAPLQPVVYCDADFGGDLDTRRSTMGVCVMMANAPVLWRSVRTKNVVLSTAESEYCAQSEGARSASFIYNLLGEMGLRDAITLPISFKCDNMSTIAMITSGKTSARTRHIDVAVHHVREKAARGFLSVDYVPTEEMIADIFTKPLPRPAFLRIRGDVTFEE